ncbi:efflux RND transporter periplasmic adaptor subunit [Vibrio aestuarianus]|uniref:efflux RND transporter periplasmic adaptor subunit n=1 Tax=Vibrio aestuarianus TaxID=28171 RepID=UPI00237D23BA|nr:efflux RND transporter periplasmic adaptor subunit [Vibrio aestuarianus]MDE1263781.1 efflux RND transporter periplasmic adaptor subunit [Vibrio aestuarianus]MDE1295709.1 efflux RND transporter periplasmic adaptor subunit [Vibrio aestuarianus]
MRINNPLSHTTLAIVLTSTACSFVPETYAQSSESTTTLSESIRPVKLMQVGSLSTQFHKTFPAKVAANQQVDLAFRINGQLTQLNLLAGQKVNKGDVLAQLDNRDATNALLNAQANHQLAKADFARKEELLERKLISKAEFDTAKAQLQSTLAALNSAQDQLSYTTLNAPFTGVIAKVDLDNHQMVQASQVVITLQGNQELDLTFNVPESYVFNMISFTQKAAQEQYRVKFHGLDDTFNATFKEMNRVVNNGSQTYQITLSFTPPAKLSILPGMSANVTVDERSANQPITILPLTAIVHDEQTQQNFVWVYQEQTQTVQKSVVELGKIRTEGTEILSGLNQGDQVVAVGANAINSEIKVSPLRWERGV